MGDPQVLTIEELHMVFSIPLEMTLKHGVGWREVDPHIPKENKTDAQPGDTVGTSAACALDACAHAPPHPRPPQEAGTRTSPRQWTHTHAQSPLGLGEAGACTRTSPGERARACAPAFPSPAVCARPRGRATGTRAARPAGDGGRAEGPRGRAAAAPLRALELGRRRPPEAPRLGGADAAPAAAAPAALDFLLRALPRRPQRPVRPVALQLAGARRQLPRPAHRLLPLHQVPLLQGALAGPGWAGPLLHGAQGRQPRYSDFIIWSWLLGIC